MVTIKRNKMEDEIDWEDSPNLFDIKVDFRDATLIEDAVDCIQADFANKSIGGGALSHGIVQEEIRFCINPELFVTMMICADMTNEETISVRGIERFSNYSGYSSTFRFLSPFLDLTPMSVPSLFFLFLSFFFFFSLF